MRHLVIGMGEIGTSIYHVLKEGYEDVEGIGRNEEREGYFDMIHICFPYDENFEEQVRRYARKYQRGDSCPVVVHSTTPLGTCDNLRVVHSPVRGVHPNLVSGIKTFVKYFGGNDAGCVDAADAFKKLGIRVTCLQTARETEALKMWSTTYYGWNIIFEKAVKAYCDEHDLPFDTIYTHANETYNEGYDTLNMRHVRRPVLKHIDGPLGGHCIVPNCHLLGGEIADFILTKQEELCSSRTQQMIQGSTKTPSS